ncbi:hypothetical protein [Dapis sp. BLCC M229]|uniref:sulfotransferase-like domain-containing protein n=1 Tax=Dapis sp. BLCC M229 TaxID=3400188 RepID=UPI003CFAF2A8
MKKILALWAHPRSTSTAFECMMKERGDFFVLHEPFGLAYYNSEDRISDRSAHIRPQPEHNCEAIWQRLQQQVSHQAVFIKDMATHINPLLDEAFLSCFESTFIIRHPAKALPSLFDVWSDFTLEEAGYTELYKLFERVMEINDKVPVVINSDDLIRNPEATVKAYCNAVGIPFIPQALYWKPSERPEVSWFENGRCHTYLKSSSGFKEQENKKYLDIKDNEYLKQAYEINFPYYQKLNEYCIKPAKLGVAESRYENKN